LPDKVYIDEYVDMLPKQAIIYKEVKAEIKANIDAITIAPNPLAEMIRMRQATGYTGILSTDIQCSAKLDRMEEIVEEAISNKRKVVIFSNWTQMTDAIDYRLASIKMPDTNAYMSAYTALITGDTKDERRQDIVNAFQNTNDIRILVGTIGAMGTGLTLTSGTIVIFLDHPWNRALYDQAVDRTHRIGQTNKVTIYNIMCKNTIDERIWKLVKDKGQMSDAIVDNDYSKIDKATIEYLLS
jgi:SNF2 family DNA or RNA helicase